MLRQARIELYINVLKEFGCGGQVMMLVEECGELLSAIAKFRRDRATEEDIVTELADVAIMVEQMAILFGLPEFEAEKERKLARLKKRLEDKINSNKNKQV